MNLSVHMHLMYEDIGLQLLQKLSRVWEGKLYLSLVEGVDANDILTKEAKIFFDVEIFLNPNRESDQYGFYKSFAGNKDNTDLILYIHDKSSRWDEWLNDITENFLDKDNLQKSLDFMVGGRTGIVASCKRLSPVFSSKDIEERFSSKKLDFSKDLHFSARAAVVRMQSTANWIAEFQQILEARHGLTSKYRFSRSSSESSPDRFIFSPGTVFLARRDVVQLTHSCVHENFFEEHYRGDGNVSHGMERLYYYTSLCLDYSNMFWSPDGTVRSHGMENLEFDFIDTATGSNLSSPIIQG